MIYRTLVTGLLLTASSPAFAANDCRIDGLDIQPSSVSASYDPFDAVSISQTFQVDVRTRDCAQNRNLFVTVDSPDPNSYDGRIVWLSDGSGQMLQARLSDRPNGQAGGQNDTFNVKAGLTPLYLQIDRGQVVRPGVYRASMRALAMLNQGNNTPQVGRPFNLVVTVQAAVGLAAASGSEISLGEITDQDRATSNVTFDAYANVAYELSLSSDNDFNLRQRDGGQGGIAYKPVVDDNVVSVAQSQIDYAAPRGEDSRRRHKLNVVVPAIGNAAAGRYRDFLTVTIKPKFGG